jgi:hypothetical protein
VLLLKQASGEGLGMIICGACKARHETVTDVRECYADRDWHAAQVESDHLAELKLERMYESPAFYGIPQRAAWAT